MFHESSYWLTQWLPASVSPEVEAMCSNRLEQISGRESFHQVACRAHLRTLWPDLCALTPFHLCALAAFCPCALSLEYPLACATFHLCTLPLEHPVTWAPLLPGHPFIWVPLHLCALSPVHPFTQARCHRVATAQGKPWIWMFIFPRQGRHWEFA